MAEPLRKEVEDLINDLQLAVGNPAARNWGCAVFLIGAGCSYSAGIPLASGIAQQCVINLAGKYSTGKFEPADANEALRWLTETRKFKDLDLTQEPEWGKLYGYIFQEHFKADNQQRDIILDAIDQSEGKINWAHVCLGELVRRGYIHTVLTTNFDQLVLQGIIRTGLLPVIADGIESLSRVSSRPQLPQVVHLHGSMHTYSPRNSRRAVEETRQNISLKGTLYNLVRDCDMVVVVGYAGGEEGVMDLLKEAAKQFENLVIYWTTYEEETSSSAQELLSIGNNKFIIPNCDADELFAQIMEGLGIGIPEWMENPTSSLIALSENFAPSKNQDIQIKIQTYQTKIQQLKEPSEEVIEESISPLDRVATLRLEGRHEEALEILKSMEAENSSEVWRMLAESAYELGQLSSDPDLMRESVSSWKKAIELVSKEESPDIWYTLQIGLGKSLQFLSDLDPDKQHLIDAVAAYTTASEEKSHEIVPRDWADAQNNLGIALQKLGEIENNEDHLEKAIEAHRAALSEYDRKRAPLNWAETLSNLGGALQTLGELRKDPKLIEQAAAEYRMALKEYTRGRVPLDWAETQSNLGGALNVLYDYTKDLSLLEEAAEAYRSAIKVPASESTGVNRAEAQSGLGDVLFKLGKQQSDLSGLQDAAAAYKSSAEFYRGSGDLQESQVIEEKLEQVRTLIAELESQGEAG